MHNSNPKDDSYVENLDSGKLDAATLFVSSCITRLSKLGPRWDRKCVYSGAATDTKAVCVGKVLNVVGNCREALFALNTICITSNEQSATRRENLTSSFLPFFCFGFIL